MSCTARMSDVGWRGPEANYPVHKSQVPLVQGLVLLLLDCCIWIARPWGALDITAVGYLLIRSVLSAV